MVYTLIPLFFIIVFLDFKGLLKLNNQVKAIIVYVVLMIAAFGLSVLLLLDQAPLSPAIVIERIIDFVIGR